MSIILEKFTITKHRVSDRDNLKNLTKYLHICNECNKECGYYIKTHEKVCKHKGLCRSCAQKRAPLLSIKSRKKIALSRIGKPTFLGRKHTTESIEKMRVIATNRDYSKYLRHEMTLEARKKISCAHRKISLNEFNDFTTEKDEKDRRFFKSMGLHWKCFEKADYKCDCCNRMRCQNAHHLDGWNWAKNKRFLLDNLVALCKKCHEDFHDIYGRGNNTIKQYREFQCLKRSN